MLLFLIFILIAIAAIYGIKYADKHWQTVFDSLDVICAATILIDGIAIIACIGCIIAAHIGINTQIKQKQIEYDSLCKRVEIINSDYEDVSRSDIIADVAEWNVNVEKAKYWGYSPWTNWYYSKKVIDSLNYIEIP